MSRKIFLWIVILLAGLGAVALAAAPAVAQGGQGFSDAFDDAQLPGWEHSPEAIVTEGVLRIGPGQFAARLGAWQDFDLSVKVRFSGEGESHINYRATDQGSYLLMLGPQSVALLRTSPQNPPQELGRAQMPAVGASEWISVQIVLAGSAHAISINDQNLINVTNADIAGPGGLIFASTGQRTTDLDDVNLQVTATAQPGALPGAQPGVQPGAQPGAGQAQPPAAFPAQAAAPTATATAPASWQDVLRSLASSQGSTFETDVFVVNLILAVLTSFILSRVYIYWGSSLSNRRKFASSFMLVTVTTTFIILVVRSSVALSLGLVGALSIIRFRAAIKEPEELAYLFFAISLGIGLGDNQRLVTLVTLAVIVIVIGLARLLRQSQADVNLHLTVTSQNPEKITLQQVMDVLARHAAKLRLLRYDESPEAVEMSFVVEFRHITNLNQTQAALQALSPGVQVSFLDNKGIW